MHSSIHKPSENPGKWAKPQRKKLWEINPRFHCSLIGLCISIQELRLLTRRCRILIDENLDDFGLHTFFVDMAATLSPVMRKLQKLTDRRYSSEIREFAKHQSVHSLELLWKAHLQQGQVAGPYWALMSHPALTKDLAARAQGDVHMLSHTASNLYQQSQQWLDMERQNSRQLASHLAKVNQTIRIVADERDLALQKLKDQLQLAQQIKLQLDSATQHIQNLEYSNERNNLNKEIAGLKKQNENLRRRAGLAENERQKYQDKLAISEGKIQALTAELRAVKNVRQYDQQAQLDHIPADRPILQPASKVLDPDSLDLCGRCVLVVGGRTGQCEHYRTLVERHNGRFIHHDGGQENSRQRLKNSLKQADAVFCPLDTISHDAMGRVKRYCAKHTKDLILMPRSSLSTFAQSLRQVANEQ